MTAPARGGGEGDTSGVVVDARQYIALARRRPAGSHSTPRPCAGCGVPFAPARPHHRLCTVCYRGDRLARAAAAYLREVAS